MQHGIVRAFRSEDVPGIVSVYNAANLADGFETQITEAEFRHSLNSPGADPEHDIMVLLNPAGDIIAVNISRLSIESGAGFGSLFVHPDYRTQGIMENLLEQGDHRIIEQMPQVPPEKSVYIVRTTYDNQPEMIALLEGWGYEVAKRRYEMRLQLQPPVEKPAFPPHLDLRPFDPKKHARRLYAAEEAAFALQRPMPPYTIWTQQTQAPTFDASLWLVLWDGDRIAGFSQNGYVSGDDAFGWVTMLGVLPQWRRNGLGMALLKETFHLFHGRGCTRVGLMVDMENRSNALALYEAAGMHVHRCSIQYRKTLRVP